MVVAPLNHATHAGKPAQRGERQPQSGGGRPMPSSGANTCDRPAVPAAFWLPRVYRHHPAAARRSRFQSSRRTAQYHAEARLDLVGTPHDIGPRRARRQPGRGRKASIAAARVARVITEAARPPRGRSRWSIRSMSRHAGNSASSVQRIWSKNDLKPPASRL
jgi:hypothetical protein